MGKKSLRENVLVPKQERLNEFEQLLEAIDINKLPNFSSQLLVNIGWRLIEVYQHILQFPLMQKPTKRGAYNSLGVASEGGLIAARFLFSVLTDKKRGTVSNKDGIVKVINALDKLIKNPNTPAYAGE